MCDNVMITGTYKKMCANQVAMIYIYVFPLWGRHVGLLWFAISHWCLYHLVAKIPGKLLDPGLHIYVTGVVQLPYQLLRVGTSFSRSPGFIVFEI